MIARIKSWIKNRIWLWLRIWLLLGFISALSAYSFYEVLKPVWDKCFYMLTCVSFVSYTRVIYLTLKYPHVVKVAFSGYWKIIGLVIHLSTINALLDELFFNPKEIGINEYLAFVSMIGIVLYQRKKWIQ